MYRSYFVLITLSTIFSASGCASLGSDIDDSTPSMSVTEEASETLAEGGANEIVETLVEENTPDVINTITSAMRASENRIVDTGLFEYRKGLIKSSQTEFEYVAILNPVEPESIYFYDSRMGFSQITKLPKQQIQSDYGFAQHLETIDILQTNEGDATDFYTFQKETIGDSQTYILISNLDEANIQTIRFNIAEGLITSATTTDSEYTFDTTYEYIISETVQNYMNNAFDPETPTVVEEN